jgi:hypothetical protein
MELGATLSTALWALGIWAATTALSLALVAAVVASLPINFFEGVPGPARRPLTTSGLLRRIARNTAGVVLVAVGVLLSIPGVPGQGLVTVVAGLILLDFPGRHRVACAFARRPSVLGAINRIRRALRRPPLAPPPA